MGTRINAKKQENNKPKCNIGDCFAVGDRGQGSEPLEFILTTNQRQGKKQPTSREMEGKIVGRGEKEPRLWNEKNPPQLHAG